MKLYILIIGLLLMGFAAMSQSPKGFQWIQHHGDLNSTYPERVQDIQTDLAGNIYVAGEVNDQFVRDSNGAKIQSIQFFPFDSLSNHGGRDVWLAKYDPQGNLLWHRYAGSGSDERYYDMVTDQNGNSYVAGRLLNHNSREPNSFGKVLINDLNLGDYIAKVSPNGNLIWHKSFGGDTIGNFLRQYQVNTYNLKLTQSGLSAFIVGGGNQSFGYQTLFGRDSLDQGIHEISFDLNGNYTGFKSFAFPRHDRLPDIESIQKNEHGTFITGTLIQDTTLIGNDTILKVGLDNFVVAAFDSSLNHVNSFYSSNAFDQFFDAKIHGDTLVATGHFNLFQNNTVNFDTITYTGGANEGQAAGLFLFDAYSNRLIGMYPSKALGQTPTATVTSAHFDKHSFGIGGSFSDRMTFSAAANNIEAEVRCMNCGNTDLFFALFDRTGNLITQDVIYSSGVGTDRVLAMHRRDSILYIGGLIGDTVIIAGVDTFVTIGTTDAYLAAYNVGLITSLEEPSGFIKASNGILAYPNPTQGQITLMGKAVSKEAQLYSISGQLVKSYRLDQNAFRQTINLENLDSGVYFLFIIGEEEKQQVKIVKQ